MRIAIVDYGMGNIHSLKGALTFVSSSADIALVNDGKSLGDADLIFLPGVGHFKNAMEALDSLGLSEVLQSLVLDKKRPMMGICLGMQLLFSNSSEGGVNPGLGLIEGKVRRIKDGDEKIPHIGFDEVNPPSGPIMTDHFLKLCLILFNVLMISLFFEAFSSQYNIQRSFGQKFIMSSSFFSS